MTEMMSASIEDIRAILDAVPSPVLVKDREHRVVIANKSACEMLGHPREVLLRCSDALMPPEQAAVFREMDERVFTTGEDNENEEEVTDADGYVRQAITRKRRVRIGDEYYIVAVITDVTPFREAEAHSRYLAFHDSLTGLPNRSLLNERIDQVLLRAQRHPARAALLYIDLDRFKETNDTLGHGAGDELIRAFATRLASVARASDTVARLGGDEFAVLFTDLGSDFDPREICGRILEVAAEPYQLAAGRAFVGASIGLAELPHDLPDRDEFHRRADLALYAAKNAGRGCFRAFDPALDARSQRRARLEADLRDALVGSQGLEVFYQPVVHGADGRLCAMEALVRWHHPTLGLLMPSEFIPIAEESGLVVPLGEWVLARATRMIAHWPVISIAVNVSPVQLRDEDIVERLLKIIDASTLPRDRVQLEVTESGMFKSGAEVERKLQELRAAGVKVVLDDFGTGYSSLSHLRRLNVDRVKIDQSFVSGLSGEQDSRAIIEAVLNIGRTLGIAVTAEGVETGQQRDFLNASGCDELQGYLFSRPLSEKAARAYLTSEFHSLAA